MHATLRPRHPGETAITPSSYHDLDELLTRIERGLDGPPWADPMTAFAA